LNRPELAANRNSSANFQQPFFVSRSYPRNSADSADSAAKQLA